MPTVRDQCLSEQGRITEASSLWTGGREMKDDSNFSQVPFPRIRLGAIDLLNKGARMHIIHGLLEIDVTAARRCIGEHRARTGETWSFTAFVATCLAQAVAENKMAHAYRDWRNRLILFDDVDVNIMVERQVDGKMMGTPYIIRAADKKTFQEIHREIRIAQKEGVAENEFKGIGWYLALPGWMRTLVWRLLSKSPHWWKRFGGTVAITAVGMFGHGIGWGIPICCNTLTLTLGGIAEKPGVVDGRIEVREYLCMTVSIDHDIIDGAPAARFITRLKELIESGYGVQQDRRS